MWQDDWIARGIERAEWPAVDDGRTDLEVVLLHRLTAWEHRPPMGKIYVEVVDETGQLIGNKKIRFDTESSEAIAYDHPVIWGVTGSRKGNLGYLEWTHLQKPTIYLLFWGDEVTPLISNIRTDLGNQYPTPPGSSVPMSNIPTCKAGVYSYRIKIRLKG